MKKVYAFLGTIILLGATGSYFILESLGSLRMEVRNLDLEIKFLEKNQSLEPKTSEKVEKGMAGEPPTPTPESNQSGSVSIPTSIIFDTQSSPALSPQTKLTATIESVDRASDGALEIKLKVFANEATSYSAWEPKDYFQIINLGGENLKAVESKGLFGSIPPKSSVSGTLIFKTDPLKNTIILQVGPTESARFYEFNFKNRNYKETFIG